MDLRDRQFPICAVLVAMTVAIPTDSSRAAQTSDATELKGTAWLCTMHVDEGKTRKGYVYFSPTTGVKLAETERSPGVDGAWWPRVEDVPKDLDEVEPNMRWEALRDQVRIYYHPEQSMYVGGRAAGKMWIGTVPLEKADPETFFREAICQGLILGRAGACPDLFGYRIDEPKDKFMVCEQRAGWLR